MSTRPDESRLGGRGGRLCALLLVLFALAGCREQLYTGLSEKQANRMLAVLLNGGVDTVKTIEPKDTFGISVDKSDLAEAVGLLEAEGLPGEQFVDMARLYEKEGLISSPMEERVRYTFVLAQSISEMLTNIDGVLVARVHIALPENDGFTGDLKPSSASVFIKYRRDHELGNLKGEIKRIVESSIEGLSYDRIAVFMSPSSVGLRAREERRGESLVAYGPFAIGADSVGAVKVVVLLVSTIVLALAALAAWLGWRQGAFESALGAVRRLSLGKGSRDDTIARDTTWSAPPDTATTGAPRSVVELKKSA